MLRVLLLIDDYNELLYLQTILRKIGLDVEGLNSQKKFADASLGFNPQVLVASAKGKKVDAISLGVTIRKVRGFPKVIALTRPNIEIPENELEASGIDLCVESPVNIKKLVEGIANLGNVNADKFFKKLEKIQASNESMDIAEEEHNQTLDNLHSEAENAKAQKEVAEIMGIEPTDSLEADSMQIIHGEKPEKKSLNIIHSDNIFPKTTNEKYQVDEGQKESRKKRHQEYLKNMEKPKPGQFIRDRILEFNKKIRAIGSTEDIEKIEDERKSFVKALFKHKD